MDIGENIRKMRLFKKITQLELSERSGIKQSTISSIENGINKPAIDTLLLISDALGCTVADLIREETDISRRIKKYRKEKNWTQQRLAIEAHVSQQAVSFIESRRNEPSMEMIRALAKAFGVPASELIGEDMEEVSQELSGHEQKLIRIFRQLNDLGKSLILTQAESYLLQPELKQEKQSIV